MAGLQAALVRDPDGRRRAGGPGPVPGIAAAELWLWAAPVSEAMVRERRALSGLVHRSLGTPDSMLEDLPL